jgi:hypothetical protein
MISYLGEKEADDLKGTATAVDDTSTAVMDSARSRAFLFTTGSRTNTQQQAAIVSIEFGRSG